MASDSGGFPKYDRQGAYHWGKLDGRGKAYHARLWARYSWFVREAALLAPSSIADVGCGDGALTFLLSRACPNARVYGVEREDMGVQLGRAFLAEHGSHAEVVRGSAEALPWKDSSISVVSSCEVIEHVQDGRALLHEAARVLQPRGTLLLSTPQAGGRAPGPLHVHEFDALELRDLLSESFRRVSVSVAEPRILIALYGNRYCRAAINTSAAMGPNPFSFHRTPSRATRRWHQLYAVASQPV